MAQCYSSLQQRSSTCIVEIVQTADQNWVIVFSNQQATKYSTASVANSQK